MGVTAFLLDIILHMVLKPQHKGNDVVWGSLVMSLMRSPMTKLTVIGGSAVFVLMRAIELTVLTGSAVIPARRGPMMSVTGRSVVFVLMGLCRKIAIESVVRNPAMRSLIRGSVHQYVMSSLATKTVPRGSAVQLIVMWPPAIRTALNGSVVQLTVRRIGTTQNAEGGSEGQTTLALRMKVMTAVGCVAKLVKTARITPILLNVTNVERFK